MKIDFNNGIANQPVAERTPKHVTSSSVSAATGATVDRTSLSTSVPSVASLVTQAMQLPAIRQDKVNALREAISSGNYSVDAAKIAGSIADSHE